ncbi:hypothetical protein HAX54_000598, partial [Datura stramonium]|nr:hypothetical protein [Datura stramonium]
MLNPKNDGHYMAITTRKSRVLGPIVGTRVEEHDDEEIQFSPTKANKPIVINVDPDETNKLP